MVDEQFVARWVERLRAEVPDAVAVFVGGSQVRGEAGPLSDVDFDVVVPVGPRDEWPAWFDEDGGRLVCVSTWIRDVDGWLAAQEQPQDWAFGLSSVDNGRLCWVADDSWRERLDHPVVFPPGEPEIDHFEGDAGKVANAWLAGDVEGLRLAAQDLARAVVSLLRPLNPVPPVRGRREALRVLLDFTVAPVGYRDDLLACLGLADRYVDPDTLYAAASRLVRGVLDLLDAHVDTVAPLVPAGAAAHLRDGTLRRYLSQLP